MKETNWKAYEKASNNEEEVYLRYAKKKVWQMEEPPAVCERKWKKGGPGRPPHNWRGMVVLCLLKIFHRKTYRELVSYIRANSWLLQFLELKKPPGKSTINDFFIYYLDKQWLEELHKEVLKEFKKNERM